MAFAPGMHVFPGGRVDASDADPRLAAVSALAPLDAVERLAEPLAPPAALAFFAAAVREAFEEVGILLAEPADAGDRIPGADTSAAVAGARRSLVAGEIGIAEAAARLGVVLRTDLLVPIARWVTPPSFARRFDARFLAAPWPPGAAVDLDPHEVVDARWMRPGAALAAMRDGSISLWLPTACALGELEGLGSVAELPAREPLRAPAPLGVVRLSEALVRLDFSSAGGVPGRRAGGFLVGRRDAVLVDPADPTPGVLDAVVAGARALGLRIVAIVVTRVDPSHAAGALDLADRLAVAAHCGPGGSDWLPARFVELADAAFVPAGDVPLRVEAIDPPDRGRIALAAEGFGVRIGDPWTEDAAGR